MAEEYSVPLSTLMEHFNLKTVVMPRDPSEVMIKVSDVNRPGLFLAGHHQHFETKRIQAIGNSEHSYLNNCSDEVRDSALHDLFEKQPPAVIFTRGLYIYPEAKYYAQKYQVALFSTQDFTANFMSDVISYLNRELAPRITRHGVLVEVYGEGVLLMGESGIGKSETAIELVKRGHRFIADDAVELRKTSATTIMGSAPENIRHFVELRGIGIVNVRRIFGIGAVKLNEKIDLVIQLEEWNPQANYDRMGLTDDTYDILGVKIPSITIPVKPGRNMAIIIEVAAINNRQKKMGYNSAKELLENLGMTDDFSMPNDNM